MKRLILISTLITLFTTAGCAIRGDDVFTKHCYAWQAGLVGCEARDPGPIPETVYAERTFTYQNRRMELYKEMEQVYLDFVPHCPVEFWYNPSRRFTSTQHQKTLEAIVRIAVLDTFPQEVLNQWAATGTAPDELESLYRKTKYTCMFVRDYEMLILGHWPDHDYLVYPTVYYLGYELKEPLPAF
jgi:hypothetical protein